MSWWVDERHQRYWAWDGRWKALRMRNAWRARRNRDWTSGFSRTTVIRHEICWVAKKRDLICGENGYILCQSNALWTYLPGILCLPQWLKFDLNFRSLHASKSVTRSAFCASGKATIFNTTSTQVVYHGSDALKLSSCSL